MALTLRPAGSADTLLLSWLGAQVFAETYAPNGLDSRLAREIDAHFGQPALSTLLGTAGVQVLIAEEGGYARGFAQWREDQPCPCPGPQPSMLELQRLYVQHTAKGRGVGTALLRAAEHEALRRGQACLWLSAWSGNEPALRFYARRGYRDVGMTSYVFEDCVFENRVLLRALG